MWSGGPWGTDCLILNAMWFDRNFCQILSQSFFWKIQIWSRKFQEKNIFQLKTTKLFLQNMANV